MNNSFKVSYVTTLPKEGNAPRVTITGTDPHKYFVTFKDNKLTVDNLIASGYCHTNQTILCNQRQWFTEWIIHIFDENGSIVFTDIFKLNQEVVFIKIDAWALGDTIAWIPFVDIFRKKHNCKVICSTFHNDLLVDAYPDIMFIKPDMIIHNIYAQYYIGASNEDNICYSPIKVNEHPLQDVASRILGLKPMEVKPDLTSRFRYTKSRFKNKYVTLSEFGSSDIKHWKLENGWQDVVDYLIDKGYDVVVISKEKTSLKNVIDLTGNFSLNERAIDIMHAEFHLGISSGLSWLAWGLDTHVVMISDVTPNWHEFSSNITRFNSNHLHSINYSPDNQTTLSEVLIKLGDLTIS